MNAEESFNPYAFSEAKAAPGEARSPQTGPDSVVYLYVLASVMIVMGGWGTLANGLGALFGVVQLVMTSGALGSPDYVRVGVDGTQVSLEVASFALVGVNFLLSIAMVAIAIGLFLRQDSGRRFGLGVILACAIWTLIEILYWAATAGWELATMTEGSSYPFGSEDGAETYVFVAVMTVGVLMQALFYAYEYGLYVFGWRYLHSDAGRAQFVRPAPA